MIWFTADQHFGHANIVKYCNRKDFMNECEKSVMIHGTEEEKNQLIISRDSVQKMNETIIRKHNERVKPSHLVYSIGDFAFYNSQKCEGDGAGLNINPNEYLRQLNGHCTFIMGNHDRNNKVMIRNYSLVLYIGGIHVYLVHDPRDIDYNYPVNLVGHVHDEWKVRIYKQSRMSKKQTLVINVGVDQWNYYPIHWTEIQKIYDRWKAGHNVADKRDYEQNNRKID